MEGFVFRQSKPAIIGMEVLTGSIKQGTRLMNIEGKVVGTVHALQEKGQNVTVGEAGMQIAVSLDGAIVGRNIEEGDTLYSFLIKDEYKVLMDNMGLLKDSDKNTISEIREIMVKKDKYWDVM